MTINLKNHQSFDPAPRPVSLREEAHEPELPPRAAPRRPRARRERNVLMIAASAILLLALVAGAVALSKARFFSSDDPERLAEEVGELILLPQNEIPTIATVSDMHALEGQEFFRNAQLGDKVLMFLASQKAVLYRPSEQLIIEVGPITGAAQ